MSENTAPSRPVRLLVNRDAIVANWRWFRTLAGAAECSAVVKADSYGLGAAEASVALAKAGCRTFFVATAEEGAAVRTAIGAGPDIFVLNGPASAHLLQESRLSPVLNSLEQIAAWSNAGPAALHIDTGMNRLGITPHETGEAARLFGADKPAFVMSHIACASTRGHAMNARQRDAFVSAAATFSGAHLSLAASAGAQLGPDYLFDMIRPGIGLYGWGGMDDDNPPLAAAARITAPILQLRDVAAGDTFGYGATGRAAAPTRAATVAIGYADGFLRSALGRGYGMLRGARMPLLGRVSMDLVILDATHADAKVGDDVEFLGDEAKIEDVAAAAGTLPYEILTTFAATVRAHQ